MRISIVAFLPQSFLFYAVGFVGYDIVPVKKLSVPGQRQYQRYPVTAVQRIGYPHIIKPPVGQAPEMKFAVVVGKSCFNSCRPVGAVIMALCQP